MIEMVVVALLVINIFLILFTFSTYRDLQNAKVLVQQTHTAMGSLVGRVMMVEQGITQILVSVRELVTFADTIADKVEFDVAQEYRSADGKFIANSMEELMDKMQSDKREPPEKFLDNLKNLFEEDDDEDDDE